MRLRPAGAFGTLLGAFVLALLITLPITWRHLHAQIVLGHALRRDLGFTESSPFTLDRRYSLGQREVVAVHEVNPHGIAARAGLQSDDVLVDYCRPDRGATALFLDLEASRGREFCTPVVRLHERPSLEDRQKRTICFRVPERARAQVEKE